MARGTSTRTRHHPPGPPPRVTGGERPCERGDWCASRTSARGDDGTWRPEPARGYRAFCDADEAIIAASIPELPGYYLRLLFALGERPPGEVLIRVPFGPTVPIRLDVDMLLRVMAEAMISWHERVAATGRLSPPDTQLTRREALALDPTVMIRPARILAASPPVLLALGPEPMQRPAGWNINGTGHDGTRLPGPQVVYVRSDGVHVLLDGGHAGRELIRLHYLARAVLGETEPKPEKLLGIPCKGCGLPALNRAAAPQHPGDPEYWSECRECRHRMKRPEYDQWVKMNYAYQMRQVTVPVLGPPPAA